MADIVKAIGMQFWGTHGYYPEENKFGAKFVVDVEAVANEDDMCQYDELSGGVSYITLYEAAKKVCTEEQHKLLQRIAQRISDEIFDAEPDTQQVTVTVKKPFVPLGGILDYTGCTITRTGKGAKSDGNAIPYTGINPLNGAYGDGGKEDV